MKLEKLNKRYDKVIEAIGDLTEGLFDKLKKLKIKSIKMDVDSVINKKGKMYLMISYKIPIGKLKVIAGADCNNNAKRDI